LVYLLDAPWAPPRRWGDPGFDRDSTAAGKHSIQIDMSPDYDAREKGQGRVKPPQVEVIH